MRFWTRNCGYEPLARYYPIFAWFPRYCQDVGMYVWLEVIYKEVKWRREHFTHDGYRWVPYTTYTVGGNLRKGFKG